MAVPYYDDGQVALYLGDCREIDAWLAADVLVTDPPYGRGWKQGAIKAAPGRSKGTHSTAHGGIAGDATTEVRDEALILWGTRPAVMFGDLMLPPPAGTKLVSIYRKPPDSGFRGGVAGFRRDVEAIYLLGDWTARVGGTRSSIITTAAPVQGSPNGVAARYGHPHAKPVDVMETLVSLGPDDAVIADSFAGSGSTLIAARNVGRKAIGVEIDEQYCEQIAKRLDQSVLPLVG